MTPAAEIVGEAGSFFSAGTRCAAVRWRPASGTKLPGVVLCHGFRGIKEWLLPEMARDFVRRGYGVLTFDYRGFGESEGETGRLVPEEQVQDIRNAISYLSAQEWIDPERIALYGTSFGGANVVAAAAQEERARCTVCQVGMGDVGRAWAEARERFRPRLEEDRVQRVLTGASARVDPGEILDNPQSNAAFESILDVHPRMRTTFPLEAVERIFEFAPERSVAHVAPRAILFLGAERDLATPVGETQALYDAAQQPKEIEVYDVTHYEIYDSPYREQAIDRACAWFDDHMPAS